MAYHSFDSSEAAAFKACKRVLKDLDWNVVSFDKNAGWIEAEKDGNLLAFGHTLAIEVKPDKNGQTRITVRSKALGPQLVDWGTNAKHEDKILDALEKLLA